MLDDSHAIEAIGSYTANLNVGGSAAFAKASSWVEQCRQTCEHSRSSHMTANDKPGRVVDVTPMNGHSPQTLTLVSGDSRGLGEYVALSYCWGQRDQPMATTNSNLQSRIEQGFSLADMPDTIQDAVLVCRRLGFRYIWIDSLCILQDDRADKKREIRKMAGIFEGSFLTIVAASASVVTQGFLEPREKETQREIDAIPFWDHSGRVGRALLQGRSPSLSDPDPVHYRAWTLEELLLSSRRLIYSGRQLLWACRGFQETDGGWGYEEIFYLDSDLDPSNLKPRSQQEQLEDTDAEPPFPLAFKHYWTNLLRQYTARQLTHTRDKLNAIHGIVSKLCDQTNLHYHAGIWREYAVPCLCWHYDSEGGNTDDLAPANIKATIPRTREREIECPTWSWGSVADPVCLPDEPFTTSWDPHIYDLAEFLDVVPTSPTEDSSQIVLRGSCLQVEDLELIDLETTSSERIENKLEFFPPVDGHTFCRVMNDGDGDGFMELNLLIWPDTQQIWEASPDTLRFMGLRSFDGVLRGLVLTLTHNSKTYERIGYFEATVQEETSGSEDEDMEVDIPMTPNFPTKLLGPAEDIVIQ